MSTVEMLLQPVLLTTATGENGPLAIWSAMTTELGDAGPGLQATFMSTALITKKSTGLDIVLPLATCSAYSCGSVRNDAGMVAVITRPLGSTTTFPAGMAAPSRRTCAPAGKEPKICTPARSLEEVRVACGTSALGIPPMMPGPGLGLGTSSSVISAVAFGAFAAVELKFIIWMTPLPDCTIKAWFVKGSTATAPHNVRELFVP